MIPTLENRIRHTNKHEAATVTVMIVGPLDAKDAWFGHERKGNRERE